MEITKIGPWSIPTPMPEDLSGFFSSLSLEWIQDIPYKRIGDTVLTLDVLRPQKLGDQKVPAIICIHGGAWRKGTNKNYNAASFAANGYVTFNIRYRLTGEAPFPADLEDCMDALRWVRAHGGEYGVDTKRIALRGGSSGAHLALMMALTAQPGEIAGVAAACAPSHLPALYQSTVAANAFFAKRDAETLAQNREEALRLLGGAGDGVCRQQELETMLNVQGFAGAFDMLLGRSVGEDAAALEPASPYHLLERMEPERVKALPPFLLLHGLADPLVPVYQSLLLHEKLREKGADVKMHLFANAKHDYMFDCGVFRPERMACILEFLDRCLGMQRRENN